MPGVDLGAKPFAKCRLAPTVKQTGQESEGQLITQFQILIVSAVKSVNIFYKLLDDFVTRTLTGASLQDPTGGLPSPRPPGLQPPPK